MGVSIDTELADRFASDDRASRRLRREMRSMSPRHWEKRGECWAYAWGAMCLVLGVVMFKVVSPDWWPLVGTVVFIVPVAVYFGVVLYRMSLRRLIRVLLEHAVCPSCGESLEKLTVEPDGCTVCRRCSAAWRIERSCEFCGYRVTSLPVVGRKEVQCPECGRHTRFSQRE